MGILASVSPLRHWRVAQVILLAALAIAGVAAPQSAHAYTYKLLYNFCTETNCTDGQDTVAGLIADSAGNLYGTTSHGGNPCTQGTTCGTVFELVRDVETGNFAEKVLYSFCAQTNCTDGALPFAGLIMDRSGNLYGTTLGGGSPCAIPGGGSGCGTVFELVLDASTGNYTEKVLHSFCTRSSTCAGGAVPQAGLIMDGSGNLYGTTEDGGCTNNVCGTVFQLVFHPTTGNFTERTIHGQGNPLAGLIMDQSGNLFGTAWHNNGWVFELIPNKAKTKWTERLLHVFTCPQTNCDGTNPQAGLVMDSSGNLYGTTTVVEHPLRGNLVFELVANKTTGDFTEKVLHQFCDHPGCLHVSYAGLIMDSSGNLYGTTNATRGPDAGTVFELVRNRANGSFHEKLLHQFCLGGPPCADGAGIVAGLTMDSAGNLYGTTSSGGANNGGTVFELVND